MKLSQQNKVSKERKRLENLKIKVNFIVIKEKKIMNDTDCDECNLYNLWSDLSFTN